MRLLQWQSYTNICTATMDIQQQWKSRDYRDEDGTERFFNNGGGLHQWWCWNSEDPETVQDLWLCRFLNSRGEVQWGWRTCDSGSHGTLKVLQHWRSCTSWGPKTVQLLWHWKSCKIGGAGIVKLMGQWKSLGQMWSCISGICGHASLDILCQ